MVEVGKAVEWFSGAWGNVAEVVDTGEIYDEGFVKVHKQNLKYEQFLKLQNQINQVAKIPSFVNA